jgi:molybdate transport system ATP-binding protein
MLPLSLDLELDSPMPLRARLACASGELLALVGPSGSGKTTLLRAVAGLLRAPGLRGSICVGGTTWFDAAQRINLAPQQRRVGLVFQHYALFPHLSAIENIAIYAINTPATRKKSLDDARQLMQRMGLEGLEQRRPAELSGGQQQRVALARALAREPQILLLDEPFSAVDAPTRQVLYHELAALHAQLQIPMILVTHDLLEARRLADRVVVLDRGETLQAGAPAQVFARPRNARVAELVGIQNHFAGRFERNPATPGLGRLLWTIQESNKPIAGVFTAQAAINLIAFEVQDKNKVPDGAAVTWVVAGEYLRVQPIASAAAPALQQNQLVCRIHELLTLGEVAVCELQPLALPAARVRVNLPTAQLHEHGWAQGSELLLTLPREGIHIMPLRTGSE